MPARSNSLLCPRPGFELMLTSIISSLMLEGRVPNGSIVDAGAHDGTWACYYAVQDPSRIVHAIDPDQVKVATMSRKFASVTNLRPFAAALGDVADSGVTWAKAQQLGLSLYAPAAEVAAPVAKASKRHGTASDRSFAVYRLDDLFRDERMGLLHLDLEGHELKALRVRASRFAPVVCT